MNLKDQRKAGYEAARSLFDRVYEDQAREFSAVEQKTFDGHVAEVKALDERIAVATKSQADFDALGRIGADEPVGRPGADGRHLFDTDQKRGIISAVKSRGMYRTEVARKALTGAPVPAGIGAVAPGVYPTGSTSLAVLFPTQVVEAPVVRYYRFNTATAAVVAEGAAKPDSGTTATPVDATLAKIATTAKFSDEFADDAPFLLNHVSDELIRAVITVENAEILSVLAGTSGILTKTGTPEEAIDVFADAISGSETANGAAPTAIIVDPTTLGAIRKAKASTAGSYFLDPVAAGPSQLHGVPLVSTPAMDVGIAWVVSPGAVVIYRRGGVIIDIGHNTDDWQKNMRTMRVEERMATAVLRPSLLTKVTLAEA